MGKWTQFRARRGQKYALYPKILQKKLLDIEFYNKKSQCAQMFTYPGSGAKGLQRLQFWNTRYNVQKWESKFTLAIDAAENTHDTKKFLK